VIIILQPTITKVQPLDDYKLYLEYENNEKKTFDVKPYLDLPFYKSLKDTALFKTVKIVDNWTIEWVSGQDISPHEIYYGSTKIN
jgi:nucleoside-specific outer membrane channel protein Tsx